MKNLGRAIKRIEAVDAEAFGVRLRYRDGKVANVSLRDLFEHPKGLASEILRGDLFAQCFVEAGALAWPNGLELCPDALWNWSEEQKKRRAA
jgi:hypothetical protein